MREQLQQILNFATGEGGEVKTYFDGRVTQSQLIVGIVSLIVILFVLAFVKKIAKVLCTIAIVCVALVYFGIASPAQIKDVASSIQKTGIEYYEKIAEASENVKIKDGSVSVKIEGKWVKVESIDGVVQGKEGVLTVLINGESYAVDDLDVINVLKTFTK